MTVQAAVPAAPALARRLVWLATACFLAAVVIGFGWDRRWHATRPFDDVWSPPHLFIYAMFALTGGTVAALAVLPRARAAFGAGIRLPGVPFPVPAPVALAGGGVVTLAAAGMLDAVWHTAFGLDETGWSAPHAMIGWGTFLTATGLAACRLALGRHLPLSAPAAIGLGVLLLLSAVSTVLGPLGRNNTPETVRAVASIPVLAAQPDAQHTARIYLEWNLTRTNPLFVPLAALAVGIGLALARRSVPRPRSLLLASLLATLLLLVGGRGTARFLGLEDDPAAWLPVPLVLAAAALAAARHVGLGERAAWLLAGACLSLAIAAVWGWRPGLVLLGAPAMLAGAAAGDRLFRAAAETSARAVPAAVLVTGAVIPLCLGAVDLALRNATP